MKIKTDILELTKMYHDYNINFITREVCFGQFPLETNGEGECVSGVTVTQTIKNLMILDNINHKPIYLYLNTFGGQWEDGVALYDIIRNLKSKVYIIGIAKLYSMGSIILQAGYKRYMTKHSAMLIHDGSETYSGETKSYEAWGDRAKITRREGYEIYYEQMKKINPNITIQYIENLCTHDTILSAREAIEMGLADEYFRGIDKIKG